MALNGWKQTNRYGLSNPVTIWSKEYANKHTGKKKDVTIKLNLYGTDHMIWELSIGKPSGMTEKKKFKTDELAQDYAKKYMRSH
jgi:hypothetical protein